MTLLDIGTQCSLDSCSTYDFLPILCPDCSKYFCRHHIRSDLHSCLSSPQKSDVQHEKLRRCVFNNCNSLSLDAYSSSVAVTCINCNRSFCAESEFNGSHFPILIRYLPDIAIQCPTNVLRSSMPNYRRMKKLANYLQKFPQVLELGIQSRKPAGHLQTQ